MNGVERRKTQENKTFLCLIYDYLTRSYWNGKLKKRKKRNLPFILLKNQ